MNNNWSKTVLQVYRYLPRITRTYDKLIMSKALNSQFTNSTNINFFSTETVADAIINLSQRKITLINLKLLIEKALKSIKPSLARLLILKFIDGKRCIDLADRLGICLRTVFRKINTALNSFSLALKRLGYTEEIIEKMLISEKWIAQVHKQFAKSDLSLIENADIKATIKSSIVLDLKVSSF